MALRVGEELIGGRPYAGLFPEEWATVAPPTVGLRWNHVTWPDNFPRLENRFALLDCAREGKAHNKVTPTAEPRQ